MLRVALPAVFALVLLGSVFLSPCPAKDGKDDVVGTRWHYKITRGDKVETGQFRCYQKELFKGKKKVGDVYPKDNDQTRLVFTDFGELNGEIHIRRVERKPPVWKGTLNRENGKKWYIEIEIKDR